MGEFLIGNVTMHEKTSDLSNKVIAVVQKMNHLVGIFCMIYWIK